MTSFLIEMAWKSLALAGLALAALQLMRSRSAAERAFVAHLALLALLLLPVATTALPDFGVAAPPAVARTYASIVPSVETAPAALSAAIPASAPAPAAWSATELLLAAYTVPAALLLLMTLLGLARLHRLRARAEVLVDPLWLTALAAAQRRLGLKHGTALLTSDEVDSPVSWGVVRPIIVVDRDAARRPDQAEAIIAHELAHVARLDWPAMLLGRTVSALFWFNPLVALLSRTAHEYSEQAADDFVLRSDVPCTEYAEVLVGAARHCAGRGLVANGVAPARGSLSRRIGNILDPRRSRLPVRLRWSAACLAGALSLGTALAAVNPAFAPNVDAASADRQAGKRAAAQLAAIPTPQTRAMAHAIRTQDWKLRRAEGGTRFSAPEAAAPLQLALDDPSPVTRRIAVWGLSELRPAEAEPALALRLADPSADVRGEAARSLGDLGAVRRSAAIAALLRDPEACVRRNAAHALGDLQDPATRPALEAAQADPDPSVRAKVGWALRQVADAERVLRRYGGG